MHVEEFRSSPGFEHENLQGKVCESASEEELREALEKAFDYRGDVTITLKNGCAIEGYIFDRRTEHSRRLGAAFSQRRAATKISIAILQHRRSGVYRTRYGGGQELGSVGEEVLGEEASRRAEY